MTFSEDHSKFCTKISHFILINSTNSNLIQLKMMTHEESLQILGGQLVGELPCLVNWAVWTTQKKSLDFLEPLFPSSSPQRIKPNFNNKMTKGKKKTKWSRKVWGECLVPIKDCHLHLSLLTANLMKFHWKQDFIPIKFQIQFVRVPCNNSNWTTRVWSSVKLASKGKWRLPELTNKLCALARGVFALTKRPLFARFGVFWSHLRVSYLLLFYLHNPINPHVFHSKFKNIFSTFINGGNERRSPEWNHWNLSFGHEGESIQ